MRTRNNSGSICNPGCLYDVCQNKTTAVKNTTLLALLSQCYTVYDIKMWKHVGDSIPVTTYIY